jgi:cell division GTPase FtsZ
MEAEVLKQKVCSTGAKVKELIDAGLLPTDYSDISECFVHVNGNPETLTNLGIQQAADVVRKIVRERKSPTPPD